MKDTLRIATVGSALVPLLVGCCAIPAQRFRITGSGKVVAEEKDVADFDAVNVSNAFEAEIRHADRFQVIIRVDDNLLKHVRVAKEGRTLLIGLRHEGRYRLKSATLRAEVTMPRLTGLGLSGASRVTVSGFQASETLEVDASGASQLSGDIEAEQAQLRLSSASQVILTGSARKLTIDGSGASRFDLSGFDVVDVLATLSGASTARVAATGRLDARLSGASHLTYTGSPTLGEIARSGASSVRAG